MNPHKEALTMQEYISIQEPDIKIEKRIIKYLVVAVIILSFAQEWLLWPSYGWEDWTTDGTVNNFTIVSSTLYEVTWVLIIMMVQTFYLTSIVISIKLCTISTVIITALGIKRSTLIKPRIYIGILLYIYLHYFLSIDYFLMGLIVMLICLITLFIFYLRWNRDKKYSLWTDIFLFNQNFPRALITLIACMGILSVIASSFFIWYEGDWAYEYYLEEMGGVFLFSDFDLMIKTIRSIGIILIACSALGIFINKLLSRWS